VCVVRVALGLLLVFGRVAARPGTFRLRGACAWPLGCGGHGEYRCHRASVSFVLSRAYRVVKWTIAPIVHTEPAMQTIQNSTTTPTPMALSVSRLDLREE
jgi:hypothetical protein